VQPTALTRRTPRDTRAAYHGSAHGDQTHGYGLYAEENDGIAIFWSEEIVPGAWSGPTLHEDVLPTLLPVFGLPPDAALTGIPVGDGEPDRLIDTAAIARTGVSQAVVRDGWKLVYRWSDGATELFDLENDPAEADDLYHPDHPEAQALWADLRPRVESLDELTDYGAPL
jgi:arylsulfatase A-like enzyme